MINPGLVQIKTITDFHRLRGLPGPVHPLVSVVRFEDMRQVAGQPRSWVLDFYAVNQVRIANSAISIAILIPFPF